MSDYDCPSAQVGYAVSGHTVDNQRRTSRRNAARRAARLAAVQALYQIDQTGYDADLASQVIAEFSDGPVGVGEDQCGSSDAALFAKLVRGVIERRGEIDTAIAASLAAGSNPQRIQVLLRAILRAGGYELLVSDDVPVAVIINEYIEIAHAFFDPPESAYVNGVLDKMARRARGDPLPASSKTTEFG